MNRRNLVILAAALLILAGSILGPEQLARYKDHGMLNQIVVEETNESSEGYRYTLNSS